MTSPQASLFLAILERLSDTPLRYIEQDFGQLEAYEMRPAVSWPCGLIDIEEAKYSDAGGRGVQLAEAMVSVRIGLVQWSTASNLTPDAVRTQALEYYEVEQAVHTALQGWSPEGFSRLLRRASGSEKRDDDIRVRVLKYLVSWQEQPAPATLVDRPDAQVLV